MTTETLEDYLAGQYHQDMDDIRELEETLERTANVFIHTCEQSGRWPYEYSRDREIESNDKVSHGTQAMIAAALAKMSGLSTLASGRTARLKLSCRDDLAVTEYLGIDCLSSAIKGELVSGSFGTNDPVTLSHAADLLYGIKRPGQPGLPSTLESALDPAIYEFSEICLLDPGTDPLLTRLPRVQFVQRGKEATAEGGKPPDYLRNAFVPLRVMRAVKALAAAEINLFERVSKRAASKTAGQADNGESKLPNEKECKATFDRNYRRFFESTLHEQLSFSEIPDSRFDPAELIFCLEGMMLVARYAADDRLFERVLNVLEKKQEESAHWRPNRPVYATPQGMTMLPVSVEGAISLMRSIALMDGRKNYQPLSTRALPMARRFWKWLRARTVQFEVPLKAIAAHDQKARLAAGVTADAELDKNTYQSLTGWHSEHVNDPGLIHLWDTSQVAEFMLAYRELLQRSIAGRTLELSRLKIDRPARGLPKGWNASWQEIVQDFEPLHGQRADEQVYEKIGEAFIRPWAKGEKERSYSMLLYGPPGTGKSSLAENMAKALGMRMVTVTVSDFLGRGGANVEARVKAIFQTLEAQFDTVILFDEIDSFLLDRDSKRYGDQDTLFQFLTPGMLTKINDLRKRERCIFIVATNYANRIDPAIKRKGRIDRHYLLQLPNEARRNAIIKKEARIDESLALPAVLAEKTLFFGYSDIKGAIEEAGGKGASLAAIQDSVSDPDRRPATFDSYLKRYPEENFPFGELLDLAELRKQIEPDFDPSTLTIDHGDFKDKKNFKAGLKKALIAFRSRQTERAEARAASAATRPERADPKPEQEDAGGKVDE